MDGFFQVAQFGLLECRTGIGTILLHQLCLSQRRLELLSKSVQTTLRCLQILPRAISAKTIHLITLRSSPSYLQGLDMVFQVIDISLDLLRSPVFLDRSYREWKTRNSPLLHFGRHCRRLFW